MVQTKTILIIEDEEEIVDVLTQMLQELGISVQSAADLITAMNRAINQRYALIICDLKIKKGSGEDFIERVRSAGQLNEKTPIIVTSGHLSSENAPHLVSKIQGAFTKPYDLDKLVAKVLSLTKISTKENE